MNIVNIMNKGIARHIWAYDYCSDELSYCEGLSSSENNFSPNGLDMAIINGHLRLVKYLVVRGAEVINYDDFPEIYNTALECAIQCGHLEIVKYLVSVGESIYADDSGTLCYAIFYERLEIIKYLVSIGVDIHKNNDSALICAASSGHLEIIKYLISIGADNYVNKKNIFRYALNSAHSHGRHEVFRYLIPYIYPTVDLANLARPRAL